MSSPPYQNWPDLDRLERTGQRKGFMVFNNHCDEYFFNLIVAENSEDSQFEFFIRKQKFRSINSQRLIIENEYLKQIKSNIKYNK